MSVKANKFTPITVSIGAVNVTEIVAGPGVRAVMVYSTTALHLCYGTADGVALPVAAVRFPIAASTYCYVDMAGTLPSVTSTSGTASVSFLGVP